MNYISAEIQEEPYITFVDYDGMTRCFFVSKVDDCDWYVVAAISEKVIDESRSNMSKSIFIALIICLILGIILSLWATNNIIRKLTEAQEEAKKADSEYEKASSRKKQVRKGPKEKKEETTVCARKYICGLPAWTPRP